MRGERRGGDTSIFLCISSRDIYIHIDYEDLPYPVLWSAGRSVCSSGEVGVCGGGRCGGLRVLEGVSGGKMGDETEASSPSAKDCVEPRSNMSSPFIAPTAEQHRGGEGERGRD